MNIESIIGIVAGIFGIVTGCAWLHGVMKQHAKQKTAYSLLKQIADKHLICFAKRNNCSKNMESQKMVLQGDPLQFSLEITDE